MDYIGKYGEYRVLAKLYELKIEAYQAIKTNQTDYDITAILPGNRVRRIQVKTTALDNQSRNNSLKGVGKGYDFLVIVAVEKAGSGKPDAPSVTALEDTVATEYRARFFMLTSQEVLATKGAAVDLYLSRKDPLGSGKKKSATSFWNTKMHGARS